MISPAGDFCFQSSEMIPLFHSLCIHCSLVKPSGMIQFSALCVDIENTFHFPHAFIGDKSSSELFWDPCTMVSLTFLLLFTLHIRNISHWYLLITQWLLLFSQPPSIESLCIFAITGQYKFLFVNTSQSLATYLFLIQVREYTWWQGLANTSLMSVNSQRKCHNLGTICVLNTAT